MHCSLCFLSYNRPDALERAVRSAIKNAGYPIEVVVHDDGSDVETRRRVLALQDTHGLVSTVILQPQGHNEGVGRAFNRCVGATSGEYVVKLDQDLTFEPDWLVNAITILESNPRIGAVGLFKYGHFPCRWQDMELSSGVAHEIKYHLVRDFVSSALVTTRDLLDVMGPWEEHSDAFAEDVVWKRRIQDFGFTLALPDVDLATNHGFGVGPSTVVPAEGQVTKIKHGPIVHG
jgi:glycosyltransferase involved in cell wall biosynthesis